MSTLSATAIASRRDGRGTLAGRRSHQLGNEQASRGSLEEVVSWLA